VRTPARLRAQKMTGLAAVLWKWLNRHEPCLARRVGIERFALITTVPSTSGRVPHPLEELVSGLVENTGSRYEDLLRVNRTDLDPRRCAPDRYVCHPSVFGGYVLVIDDTWTTGAHAQSASAALKAAGAAGAGVLAIGRWVTPGYRDHGAWLTRHRAIGWDWSRCCLEPDPH
jgi:predicted amidophosphoribosyltransferase